MILIDCSRCLTPLQLPPGARSIRCAICDAITVVAESRSIAAPPGTTNGQRWLDPPLIPPPGRWFPPPGAHGRKRAVICGISYRNSPHELKGCLNDAKCMRYLLVNRFHFPESSIVVLTEEERDPCRIPTKQNIRMALYWLVQGCQPGDSLFFHYSGHGLQQKDDNGDEIDGYDETLLPLDFETQGMIVDDEINETIVRPLPPGVKLHAIVDACHSGTVLDLPYLCRMNRSGQYEWEDHRPRSGYWKGTSGGEVISFSGCDDHQTSADTAALSRIPSIGAMTYCFIKAIEQGHGNTYGSMLNSMRSSMRNIGNTMNDGPITSLLTMLLRGGRLGGDFQQEPQLTSSNTFDAYSRRFSV